MSNMYLLGCSHVAGCELEGIGYGGRTEYNLQNSYAAYVARLFDYVPVNLAEPGGSNDCMFRKFMETLDSVYKPGDAFLAGYTGFHRTELFDYQLDKWINFYPMENEPWESTLQQKAHDGFMKMWVANEATGYNNKLKNILAIDAICKARSIRVFHTDSFANFSFPEKQHMNWLNPDSAFLQDVEELGFSKTPDWHYELEAHITYAQKLLETYKPL